MHIPDDIQQYVRKKYAMRIMLCLLTEAVIVTYLVFYGERTFAGFGKFSQTLMYLMLLFAPIIGFKIPITLIDRSWCGEIVRIEINSSMANTQYYKPNMEFNYIKNTVYLHVKCQNGRIIRKRAFAINSKYKQDVSDYHVGDFVIHLAGTTHIQEVPAKASDRIICVVCGGQSLASNKKCGFCNHSLHLTEASWHQV